MEPEVRERPAAAAARRGSGEGLDFVVVELESYVNVDLDLDQKDGDPGERHDMSQITKGFPHFHSVYSVKKLHKLVLLSCAATSLAC